MKLGGKNKSYTFMLIPHDSSGKALSFHLPSAVVRFIFLVLILSVAAFSFSLIYSTFLSGKLVHYGFMAKQDEENVKKIESFETQTEKIQAELQSVLDQNNELRQLLGLKINKKRIDFTVKNQENPKSFGLKYKLNNIQSNLSLSLTEAQRTKISFLELKAKVADIKKHLASTPSSWPVYGPLVSGFGYRSYPWRGMHRGVDIKAEYGAPVRATAPGVICYSGWMNGYGRTIEIDHGRGFKTLYGHNSVLASIVGEHIEKGQIVAFVGLTGWTTGPHLHYEVKKYDIPINPVAFLNLNVLSAGKYF